MTKKDREEKDIIYVSGYEYTRVRDRFRDVKKETLNNDKQKILEDAKNLIESEWGDSEFEKFKEILKTIDDIENNFNTLLWLFKKLNLKIEIDRDRTYHFDTAFILMDYEQKNLCLYFTDNKEKIDALKIIKKLINNQ